MCTRVIRFVSYVDEAGVWDLFSDILAAYGLVHTWVIVAASALSAEFLRFAASAAVKVVANENQKAALGGCWMRSLSQGSVFQYCYGHR